ncbi:MAG: hypothetical protein CVU05_12030 [Bacteroidetes bacterium HGW-Bacteroidetes-21]|nr:MAG: hypothetical protein CVU05_12030 [Bacteroidetes bacterium HGW-Bacteroidetes-21]
MVVYEELKNRVQGMSMHDAALEVNHWCHEKVTYKGSDVRTSSPLNTMKYSFGRCGEESVFTVVALRTVGIPARQVYTPRWAHSDDNHAWVEVWVDGKWYFMGACEPEPELNLGWFAYPASRAMLVHTRVYGKYFGDEEIINSEDRFSELNLISIYAASKKVVVCVKDKEGVPVKNATVEYRLYNYAEFFPIASKVTNEKGQTSMSLGMGDLMIFAQDGEKFGFKPVNVPTTDTVEISLIWPQKDMLPFRFNQVPPVGKPVESISGEKSLKNAARLKVEDSLRAAYISTFMSENEIRLFARQYNYDASQVITFFQNSYGNHKEIYAFLASVPDSLHFLATKLLAVISEKDIRDVTAKVLTDHLIGAAELQYFNMQMDADIFYSYVLNPRISYENLSDWRGYLKNKVGKVLLEKIRQTPEALVLWIKDNVLMDVVANKHSRNPLTPAGVYDLRVSDKKSRDIFFVAMCRVVGIPSRLNPETQMPQYYQKDQWVTVEFDAQNSVADNRVVMLNLTNPENNAGIKSTINFTLSYLKNGSYRLYELPEEKPLNDFVGNPLQLAPGNYLFVTGNRLKDGTVLSDLVFFEAVEGSSIEIPVSLRQTEVSVESYEVPDLKISQVFKYGSDEKIAMDNALGKKGMLLVFIDPDKEPSKHVIQDISTVTKEFERWGGALLFVLSPDQLTQTFNPGKFVGLPLQRKFVVDKDNLLMKEMSRVAGKNLQSDYPVVCLISPEGKILFLTSGYRIGTGNEILQLINKAK